MLAPACPANVCQQRMKCNACHFAGMLDSLPTLVSLMWSVMKHPKYAALQAYRQHKAVLDGLDIRGRIFITPQGINAQYSGPEADAVKYAQWVEQQPHFQVGLATCGTVAPCRTLVHDAHCSRLDADAVDYAQR